MSCFIGAPARLALSPERKTSGIVSYAHASTRPASPGVGTAAPAIIRRTPGALWLRSCCPSRLEATHTIKSSSDPRSTPQAASGVRRHRFGAATVAPPHTHTEPPPWTAATELDEYPGCESVVPRPVCVAVWALWNGRLRDTDGAESGRTALAGVGVIDPHHEVTDQARLRSRSAVRARDRGKCDYHVHERPSADKTVNRPSWSASGARRRR